MEGKFHFDRPLPRDVIELSLKELTMPYKGDPVICAKEIMDILNISKTNAYEKIQSGKLSAYEFCLLVRALIQRNDFTLIDLCLPSGYKLELIKEVEVDGSLDDESRDMHVAFGNIIESYDKRNDKETMKWAIKAKAIIERVIETINQRGK